jgi:hypothetical protein
MRNNIIAIIVILALVVPMLAPLNAAQEPLQDYGLTINDPIVFLASSMSGNVSGPNGTEYNLILVNMTSFETFQIGGGIFNSSYTSNYTRYMNSDYYPAGRYTLNLTVDGITIMFIQVSLVYNQAFVFWEKIKSMSEELTTVVYGLQDMYDWREEKDKHDNRVDIILFFVMLESIIIVMVVGYFVVLRVLKVKYACTQLRGAHKLRQMIGMPIDPVDFADNQHKEPPEESQPKLNPIPEILAKCGIPSALAYEYGLDMTADWGMAELIKNELVRKEKKKLKRQMDAKIKAAVK